MSKWEVSDLEYENGKVVIKTDIAEMPAFMLPGNQYTVAEYLTALEAIVDKAQSAVGALANRWVRVDMTTNEERTVRELNDAIQALLVLHPGRANGLPK